MRAGARARVREKECAERMAGEGETGNRVKILLFQPSYFNILSALRGITHTTSGRLIFETDHKRWRGGSWERETEGAMHTG